MPVYEFKCEKCDLKFEKYYSKVLKNTLELCPVCNSNSKKLMSLTNFKMGEVKSIPKEIDLEVGRDAEKRWLAIEERNSQKEKVRKENNSQKLSKNPDGSYTPVTITEDSKVVSEDRAVEIRKDLFNKYNEIVKDPKTEKTEIQKEER